MAAADNPYYIAPANPLQALMTGVQGYDAADKRRKENEMETAFKALGPQIKTGGLDNNALATLYGLGPAAAPMIAAAGQFAGHQETIRHNQADEKLKQQALSEGKLAPGFQYNQQGNQSFIPGGPADPNYISAASAAKTKPLPQATVAAIMEAGKNVTDADRLQQTFQDQYGGKYAGALGDAQNLIGRNVGAGYEKQAQWWQDYQEHKNIIRNKLFGSALTRTEAGEFDKAAISPGMTSETIRANMAKQMDAARRAAQKIAGYYVKAGHDPSEIETALGFSLKDIGIGAPESASPTGKDRARVGAPAAPAAPMAPQGAVPWNEYFR